MAAPLKKTPQKKEAQVIHFTDSGGDRSLNSEIQQHYGNEKSEIHDQTLS
jgi:hypothetical protein